jgi:hypothetical protein
MRVMQGSAQQHRGYQTAWLPGHVGSAISTDCAFVFEIVTGFLQKPRYHDD